MIPTLAFGIPGSGAMALLLGAMLIVGLNPGPEMLKSRLDVTFSMVWVLIISNIIVAALCFLILNHLAALTFIRGSLLIPFLMFLVFIGSFTANNDLNDNIATLIFGFIGFCMVKFGWPRPPLILGLTLGKIAENYLWISTAAYGAKWLTVPDGHRSDRIDHLHSRLSDDQRAHGQSQVRAPGRRGLIPSTATCRLF